MRVLVMSDVHVEFHRDGGACFIKSLPDADVLVLAGDISVARNISNSTGLMTVLPLFAQKYPHVVFVLGNHDFYYGTPGEVMEKVTKLVQKHPNLHWLENSSVSIDGQRFVGATLWFPQSAEVQKHKGWLTDFRLIGKLEPWVYQQCQASIRYLQETVTTGDVVVTHHLPTPRSVSARFQGQSANVFFVCNVENIIKKNKPRIWIHGHTHDSKDYMLGSTHIICNPFGYAGHEENREFNDRLVLELEST